MEDLYKDYARIYDIIYFKEPLYRKEVSYLESLVSKTSMDILDLCGGTGSHANMLINDGHRVTIVDRSQYMLEVAKNKNPDIEVINSDIFSFETDNKYDLIMCMYGAIHYTEDLDKVGELANSLKDMLKEGGKVVFDLRYSYNLPEDNGLEMNNGWWNRKFWKRKKGVNDSDIYVVTAFNREEHFLDVHNLYHCDPFVYRHIFKTAGFEDVRLMQGYTDIPFDPVSGENIVVMVASA